jgi:hypothetical protein
METMDATSLRTFRSMAEEVRLGFSSVQEASGEMRVVHGYLESKDILVSYRPLCLPVRRASKDSDRMSFRRTCKRLEESASKEVLERLADVSERYDKVMAYLASHTILNDRPVEHKEVFEAWMDAVIFGEFGDKDQDYRKLIAECGKAVEGIAVRLTEAIAERILELDDVIALELGEPAS